MPRVRYFIRKQDKGVDALPTGDLKKAKDLAPDRYNRDQHGVSAVRRWLKENRSENYREKEGA